MYHLTDEVKVGRGDRQYADDRLAQFSLAVALIIEPCIRSRLASDPELFALLEARPDWRLQAERNKFGELSHLGEHGLTQEPVGRSCA
jgi:hypothetical protein